MTSSRALATAAREAGLTVDHVRALLRSEVKRDELGLESVIRRKAGRLEPAEQLTAVEAVEGVRRCQAPAADNPSRLCGRPIGERRPHAKTCGDACRQRVTYWRRREAEAA